MADSNGCQVRGHVGENQEFVKRRHGFPGVVVCPSPKKRQGFFFLSRRAMVILKV